MNLFKRTTASVALVALVSSVFATGVSANSADYTAAANALAAQGVINSVDNSADYRLYDMITRGEQAKVIANLAGVSPKASCEGKFADVSATTPNNWVCGYVEALLENGLISANANYNPNANVSKSEAVKFALSAAGADVTYGSDWQADAVAYAVENGYVSTFSDYNTAAVRGFVFSVAAAASTSSEDEGDDILSELDKLLGGDEDETTNEDNTDTETPVVSGNGELEVSLSATTPEGSDITKDAKAVNVLEFDVTAGNEDVSITGVELERTGFGSAAADQVAVFSNEGRVSKEKSFNSDDQANVTFSPAFVVKAGETRTLTVRVNVGGEGEFAVRVNDITASADVSFDSLEGNTFDAKDTQAAVLEVKNEGVNSTVTSGETQADVAEFNLKNEGSASTSADVDVVVTSVTLKEIGSVDHEDFLENLTLSMGGTELASVSSMNGKYVTFEFDGVTIDDGKNETFKVTADITGGAGDKIQFELDSVVDIVANASRYNSVNVEMDAALTAANGTFDEVSVEAGELTIYAIDSEKDKIRGDKDDVVLGQLKIVNVAGKNLELDNLKVNIDLSGASTTTVDELEEIIENVEFEINGTSYDLNGDSSINTTNGDDINGDADFSETDLDIVLPQGTTIITVRADTQKDLDDGTTLTMTLADAGTATTGGLVVVETEDDENVGDISPSSLSWDAVEVENASVTVSNVPLANVKVVKGASDVVALQFEVEAGEASSINLDEVKVSVTASGSNATKDEVSEVALYKGSVSDANALDRVSGSKLASGVATFDGFELTIGADETETFIVTVNTVDTTTVVNKVIIVSMDRADLSLEDDENDTITLTSSVLQDKEITVQDSGSLTLTADATNVDNEDVKSILAGEETVVFSLDTLAQNEAVNVETVVFTTNSNLKTIVKSAKLYLDDVVVATASNSDVSDAANSTITFDNISNLDFATETEELRLSIVTETIGFEKIGDIVSNVLVTNVAMSDAKGVDSNEDVTVDPLTSTSAVAFNVSPVELVASVKTAFNQSNTAIFDVTVNNGENSQTGSNAAPVAEITSLTFTEEGNITATGYTLKDEDGNTLATGADASGDVTFTGLSISISDVETLKIEATVADASTDTYGLTLKKDGIVYDVNGTTGLTNNTESTTSFGSKN